MTEKINVARLIYIGMGKLMYREWEILDMTPRKLFLIYDEYLITNGYKKEGDEYAIDALM